MTYYFELKSPNNENITLNVPSFEYDSEELRIRYKDDNLELNASDKLRYSKDFKINCKALDEAKRKEILTTLKQVQEHQKDIDELTQKVIEYKYKIDLEKQYVLNLAGDLTKQVFSVAFEHKGIIVKEDDINVGDIFLTVEYKTSEIECNWAKLYLWTVTKVDHFGSSVGIWAEKIAVRGYDCWTDFEVSISQGQYDLVCIINKSNEAYKLNKTQRKEIKARLLECSCDKDYKTFIQDIKQKYGSN